MHPKDKKVLKFISLMQLLYEMCDDDVFKQTVFDTKVIKTRCFDLQRSLKKEVWRVYGKGISKIETFENNEQWDKAVEQHCEASNQMSELFETCLEIANLDEVKQSTLETQLKLLFKQYGI